MYIFRNLLLLVSSISSLSILYSSETCHTNSNTGFCTDFNPTKKIPNLHFTANVNDETIYSSIPGESPITMSSRISIPTTAPNEISSKNKDNLISNITMDTGNISINTSFRHQIKTSITLIDSRSYESPLPSPRETKCPRAPKPEYKPKYKIESRFGLREKLATFDFCKQASSELHNVKNNLLDDSKPDDWSKQSLSKSCTFLNCNLRLNPKHKYIINYLLENESLTKKAQMYSNKHDTCIHRYTIEHDSKLHS